jgi:imidazolonepropionase-like amidohydrolase
VTTGGSWSSSLDENKALALAEATRNAGTWNCATFTVLSPSHTQPKVPAIKESAAWRYLSPSTKGWYDDPSTQPPRSRDLRAEQNRKRFVKMLHDAGAGLMLGTDTGVQYVLPGVAIHEELQHLVDAGLTPYEALRTGTVSPMEFLGMERNAGTIAVGHRADLLLVANNPLGNVAHVSQPIGVMTQGRWFSATKLQDMLDTLAESY